LSNHGNSKVSQPRFNFELRRYPAGNRQFEDPVMRLPRKHSINLVRDSQLNGKLYYLSSKEPLFMNRIAASSSTRPFSDVRVIAMSLGGLVILLSVVVVLIFKTFLNSYRRFLLRVFSSKEKMQSLRTSRH
jgi:hypothetical protein